MVRDELIEFIRDGLGCGCPDDVLDDLRVDPHPAGLAGLPVDATISAGGRLLVAVCASRPWAEIDAQLDRCFATGRQLRDEGGYNRFRLVVVAGDPDVARRVLDRRFETLAARDDRLHLHVVGPAVLPDVLK